MCLWVITIHAITYESSLIDFCGFSCDALGCSGSNSPSSPSTSVFPQVSHRFDYGSLCFILSVVRWSLSEDSCTGNQSMGLAEYHWKSLISFSLSSWVSVLFSLWVLAFQTESGIGSLSWYQSQYWPVTGWPVPWFLNYLYPGISCRKGK